MQLNGVELGWVLGMMINMTNIAPMPPEIMSISLTTFIPLVILFVIFIVISMIFLCHACKRRSVVHQVFVLLFSASK